MPREKVGSMARKVRADKPGNLSKEIQAMLEGFSTDLGKDLGEVTKKVAQEGVKMLKSASSEAVGGSGEYAKGWGLTDENERLVKRAIIHHKTMPGLPHLLEHGHLSRNGTGTYGTVKAYPHIKDVEDKITALYEREVLSKL